MLEKVYGKPRLEAACKRVLTGTRINYTLIKNILASGLDKMPLAAAPVLQLPLHDNIRGKEHYQ
ncbi:MAG TPA: hypothetical protein VFS31_03400 [Chitinophagaceae bacterium]|nr:hypothetical protein [Chitinophagaceae bacterium]